MKRLGLMLAVLCLTAACSGGGSSRVPTSSAPTAGKADTPADETLARFNCVPSDEDAATFEDHGVRRVQSVRVDVAYGIADMQIVSRRAEDGWVSTSHFTGDLSSNVELGGERLGAVWDDEDTFLWLGSADGEKYVTPEDGGLTIFEDFLVPVDCSREALSDDALLRMFVLKNLDEVERVAEPQLGIGIDIDAYDVRCLADGRFSYGNAPVGVCQAGGDLHCPNCTSAFGITVSTDDDSESFDMKYTVVRQASEL